MGIFVPQPFGDTFGEPLVGARRGFDPTYSVPAMWSWRTASRNRLCLTSRSTAWAFAWLFAPSLPSPTDLGGLGCRRQAQLIIREALAQLTVCQAPFMFDPPSNHVTCQVPDPLRRADLLAVRPFGVAFFFTFCLAACKVDPQFFLQDSCAGCAAFSGSGPICQVDLVRPRGSSCVCGSLGP